MKKIYTLVFAALCAAVVLSCNKETLVETTADEQPAPVAQSILNPVTLTFETPEPSKVAINEEGTASWEEGDQVKIICFNADGQAWTSEPITVVGGKITATVEDADVYYAVYPASATIALENVEGVDNLKVTIATKQDGTFKNACYYAAKTTKDAKTFNFKAVSGILKFQADPEYKVMNIRDVEKTAERHAFAETETCTFDADGNVTVAPVSSTSSMITVNLDGNGTYYAAICGNAMNEAGFRFSKDAEDTPDEERLGYEPGVFYNNLIKYAPAKIKNFGKLTDKIVTDVYVSPDGNGTKDGCSAANPAPASDLAEACLGNTEVSYTAVKGLLKYTGVWNCFRLDGLTIHFAEGEYSDAFTVAGNNSSFELTLQGEEGAVLKGANIVSATREGTSTIIKNLTFTSNGAKALSVTSGVCNLENCNFIGCTTTSGNGAALVMNVTAQVTAKNCIFQKNKASNGPALCLNSGTTSDDFVIFSAENCVFGGIDKDDTGNGNEASASGGAILIAGNAKGGQVRFNNCRFGGNKVTGTGSYGAVIFCNNETTGSATAVLFNDCTFYKNTSDSATDVNTGFGYSIYGNTGSRMGFNNCTWNVQNKVGNSNGSEIVLIGSSVLANSTIWGSVQTGKRALAWIGSKVSLADHATVVNSVVHQKSSTYYALFLSAGYYLKMWGSIYGDLKDNSGSAKSGIDYVFDNCVNRGRPNSDPADASNKEVAKDGVMQQYYTYTFNKTTYPDFTPMKLSAVKDAVKGTAGIGEIFDAWLTEIGAYDVDIMGNPRNADAMSPGSIQVSWSN